jgi:hypothetical protein
VERVRIGCSGWSYDEWRGGLYPEGLPARRRLERYAEVFDTVEVNATFYRLPKESTVRDWTEQVPGDFRFAVKSSRYLTHMKRLHDIADGVARFWEPLEPLRRSHRLGPVLWQLPENFQRDDDLLAQALDRLPRAEHCFEFRHPSWRRPGPRAARRAGCLAGDRRRQTPAAAGGGAGWPARLPAPALRPPRARRQLLRGRARRLAPADRRLALPPPGLRLPQQRLAGLRAGQREISAEGSVVTGRSR